MKSIHYGRILKRAFERIWDTLSDYQRLVIIDDVEHETELAKWFYATVEQTAQARYESDSYWMNDPESFKHPRHEVV